MIFQNFSDPNIDPKNGFHIVPSASSLFTIIIRLFYNVIPRPMGACLFPPHSYFYHHHLSFLSASKKYYCILFLTIINAYVLRKHQIITRCHGYIKNKCKYCTITHVFLAQRSQIISLMHPRLLTIIPQKENIIF